MLKTVGGDDAEDTAPAEREAPVLTDIPGIDVISPAVQPEEKPADSPRFALRYSQPFGDRIILVFTDRQTGVQYITNDDLTGFSPLLDAEGRPLI